MAKIKIDKERCKGCQLCLIYCSKGLIKTGETLNRKGIKPMVYVNGECSGCRSCDIICPDGAVKVYK